MKLMQPLLILWIFCGGFAVISCETGSSPDTAKNNTISGSEIPGSTKLFALTDSVNLKFLLNKDINQDSSLYLQNGQWIDLNAINRNQDYCEIGGAGSDIREQAGNAEDVVFIKSVPDTDDSIRIGLPGLTIKTFVMLQCNLVSVKKADITYDQMKSMTSNLFKLIYK
jgi:hypothetical protein